MKKVIKNSVLLAFFIIPLNSEPKPKIHISEDSESIFLIDCDSEPENLSGNLGEFSLLASKGSVDLTKGIKQKGYIVDDTTRLTIKGKGIGAFSAKEGTIECWIQPGWIGKEVAIQQIFNMMFKNGFIKLNRVEQYLQFNSSFLGQYKHGHYRGIKDWKKNTWYHIALCWESDDASTSYYLYVNGEQVASYDGALISDVPYLFSVGGKLIPTSMASVKLYKTKNKYDQIRLSSVRRYR